MEKWKDIKGYEGRYQVSDLGYIKSLNYNHTGKEKLLKFAKTKKGYLRIYLPIQGTKLKKCLLVHRLVMFAFTLLGEKLQVNHIDGDKENNCLTNLEWNTREENMQHSYNNGLHKKRLGKDNHLSKKVAQYNIQGHILKVWGGAAEAARAYSVYTSSISRAAKGKCKCKGFIWQYVA